MKMNNFIFGFGVRFDFYRGFNFYFPLMLGSFGFVFFFCYTPVYEEKKYVFHFRFMKMNQRLYYFLRLETCFIFSISRGYHFLNNFD